MLKQFNFTNAAKSLQQGLLIAIEGADGSGKSSLAHNLYLRLADLNLPVILTREPGGTALGEQLKAIVSSTETYLCPKAEFLLFAASRAEHFEKVVIPALTNKTIVISDRLADSSIVYQGYARGLDIKTIETINQWAMNNLKPAITLYVKVTTETVISRIKKRNIPLSVFEQEKSFITKTIQGFDTLYKNRPDAITLNGDGELHDMITQAEHAIFTYLENS